MKNLMGLLFLFILAGCSFGQGPVRDEVRRMANANRTGEPYIPFKDPIIRPAPGTQPPPPSPGAAKPPVNPFLSDDDQHDTRHTMTKAIGDRIQSTKTSIFTTSDSLLKPVLLARKGDRLNELKRVEELRKGFKSALISSLLLDETCIQLDRELKHAGTAYYSLASAYRDRSSDYTDAKLRDSCIAMAEHYEKLRENCSQHRKQLDELRAQVPALIKMVRESGDFISDYELFVISYASEVVPEEVVIENTTAIQTYSKSFEGFENALKTYREGVSK